MLLGKYYNGLEIHRKDKIIFARFLSPHRIISTCRVNGGLKNDLSMLFNHQSCEPCNHTIQTNRIITQSPLEYLQMICKKYDFDNDQCAFMGTAANMNYAIIKDMTFRDLTVISVCTGGVETNAGRAGDPANYFESMGKFEKTDDSTPKLLEGTINTMVFINKPLTDGTLVRTIVTATEAKTAALQELNVNSRYSDGLATGTGTDQIGVACQLFDEPQLTSAGKHSKLGELIGKTVKQAVKQTLSLQNGMTPERQRSVKIHMERFGSDKKTMKNEICSLLDDDKKEVFNNNFEMINRDPLTVAAVAALIHLRDKISWGILPESCLPEVFSQYGAQIVVAISGKIDRMSHYYNNLETVIKGIESSNFSKFIYNAIAMGFNEKWN